MKFFFYNHLNRKASGGFDVYEALLSTIAAPRKTLARCRFNQV
jgi:hypothetical protein